jgi:hypothetical protein
MVVHLSDYKAELFYIINIVNDIVLIFLKVHYLELKYSEAIMTQGWYKNVLLSKAEKNVYLFTSYCSD